MSEQVASIAPPAESAAEPAAMTAWQRLSFNAVRGFLQLHTRVWGLHGLYVTCRWFGTLEWLINYKRRRKVRRMLKTVYGRELSRKDRRRAMRAHFMRQRCDKAFYLICDMLPADEVVKRFSIENQHLLDDGLARGKGLYALLCHHGAHHVNGLALSLLGYRVAAIRDPNEAPVRRYIRSLWEKKYPDLTRAKVLYSGDFVREFYRMFKDNWALGSALDITRTRDSRLRTIPVQIFGEEREFLTGTLQIALRCKAVVVQAFVVSLDDFHYELVFLGPMTDADTAEESPELLKEVLQKYADNIAEYARKYPDHITRV